MTLKERLYYLNRIASDCEHTERILEAAGDGFEKEQVARENNKVRAHWQRLIDEEVEEVLMEVWGR